jgi:hypothetical protein
MMMTLYLRCSLFVFEARAEQRHVTHDPDDPMILCSIPHASDCECFLSVVSGNFGA